MHAYLAVDIRHRRSVAKCRVLNKAKVIIGVSPQPYVSKYFGTHSQQYLILPTLMKSRKMFFSSYHKRRTKKEYDSQWRLPYFLFHTMSSSNVTIFSIVFTYCLYKNARHSSHMNLNDSDLAYHDAVDRRIHKSDGRLLWGIWVFLRSPHMTWR